MLDAKVGAIGPQLDYGNKHKTTLPTYLAVGGALSVEVAEKHQVAAALSSRYFFQPTEAKLFMLGGGLDTPITRWYQCVQAMSMVTTTSAISLWVQALSITDFV